MYVQYLPVVSLIQFQIYLNKEIHYKDGYTVSVQPSGVATWKAVDANHIQVTHNAGLPEATAIEVNIKPTS